MTQELSAAEVAAVRRSIDDANDALRNNDYEGWRAHWTPDAVILPPDRPRIRGSKEQIEFTRSGGPTEEIELTDWRIEGREDLAVATTHLHWKRPGTEVEGDQIMVLHRQPDGRWLIASVIFNTDGPNGRGAPSPFRAPDGRAS